MPFTSVGYDGTVDELQWAKLIPSAGSSTYGVVGANDMKVTAVAGAPLTVSVAAGTAWGHGVMDAITTNTTIECDPISSGTRWDLIALRRNWQPLAGGPTTVVNVTGTSTKAIPGDRLDGPGVEDDQPLALVQWTAGQTQPTAIVDMRCWAGNGGMVAVDALVKTYLDTIGTVLLIGETEWRYVLGANNVPGWFGYNKVPVVSGGVPIGLTALKPGWTRPFTAGSSKPRVWSTDGVTAHVTGMVQFNAGGGENIIGLPAEFAPASPTTLTYLDTVQASNGPSNPVGGAILTLGIEGGIIKIVYQSKTVAIGSYVPLTGTWLING